MFVDLHMHTYFSDGTQSPEEVVTAAKANGLSVISVCDHNTVAAYARLIPACAAEGIELVRGAEIDVYWKGDERLHLLAYNFDPANQGMGELLNKSRAELDHISVDMIQAMEKDYPQILLSDFENYRYPLGRGGWKGVNYLYDRGLSESVADAMKYYGQYSHYRPDFYAIEDACRVVRSAGGVPVLAHPGGNPGIQGHDLSSALEELKAAGIGGLECCYPRHDGLFTRLCSDFCRANELCITCGGDSHGTFSDPIFGIGVMKVDSALLDLEGIYPGR